MQFAQIEAFVTPALAFVVVSLDLPAATAMDNQETAVTVATSSQSILYLLHTHGTNYNTSFVFSYTFVHHRARVALAKDYGMVLRQW